MAVFSSGRIESGIGFVNKFNFTSGTIDLTFLSSSMGTAGGDLLGGEIREAGLFAWIGPSALGLWESFPPFSGDR